MYINSTTRSVYMTIWNHQFLSEGIWRLYKPKSKSHACVMTALGNKWLSLDNIGYIGYIGSFKHWIIWILHVVVSCTHSTVTFNHYWNMQLKDEIITFTHIFISEFLDFAALASIQYKTVHRYLLNVYNLTFTAKLSCVKRSLYLFCN